jgi:hypothetical protein
MLLVSFVGLKLLQFLSRLHHSQIEILCQSLEVPKQASMSLYFSNMEIPSLLLSIQIFSCSCIQQVVHNLTEVFNELSTETRQSMEASHFKSGLWCWPFQNSLHPFEIHLQSFLGNHKSQVH